MDDSLWQKITTEVINETATAKSKQSRYYQTDIEVEIQFGTFNPPKEDKKYGRFESSVKPDVFFRLRDHMLKVMGKPTYDSIIEDRVNDSFRESKTQGRADTKYYSKYKIWTSYNVYKDFRQKTFVNTSTIAGNTFASELNTRFNVSNEIYFKNYEEFNDEYRRVQEIKLSRQRGPESHEGPKDFQPKILRSKHRITFKIPDVGYLDLTEATETNLDTNESFPTKYEIELEIKYYKDFERENKKIKEWYERILRIIQDTTLIYTNSEKNNLYKYISGLLNLPTDKISYSLVAEARDLKMEDMVYGGIVGNRETNYCVTHKADGVRKWMAFSPSGVWAMMPGTPSLQLFYRCKEKKDPDGNLLYVCPYDAGYIFDGELIPRENRKDKELCDNIFYIFDCICEKGVDIRNVKRYGERMDKATKFNEFEFDDKQLNRVLRVFVKGYKTLNGTNLFFRTMDLMFKEQNRSPKDPSKDSFLSESLPYKQDGFMFIPLNVEYNRYAEDSRDSFIEVNYVNRDFPDIYNRSLVYYPDICKWKPKEERTIDFVVKIIQLPDGSRKAVLESIHVQGDQRINKIFEGSPKYPLNNRVDTNHILLQNLPPNAIVEFRWDEKNELLVPTRLRTDKISPNRYFSAINIWNGIFDGIEAKTLIGQSFQLMFAYHNRIKCELYEQIIPHRCHKVLLDIGSGRGGDIRKWGDVESIFAVEPNEEHRKELVSRLETSLAKNKVTIIPTGGEDYHTITNTIQRMYGDKVCAVSIMLSMSFFHGKFREGLRNTIERNLEIGGEVLMLTIDGDTVKQVFVPTYGDYVEKNLQFLDATMKYEPNTGKLFIDIPGTIVSHQEEVPPKLSELFKEWDNFLPIDVSRADKQNFLNPDEKAVSNMYTSLRLIYLPGKRSEIEIERIVPYSKIIVRGQEGQASQGSQDTSKEHDFYGISVFPSDYVLLSSVLKAIDEEYQNNNNMKFRRDYVQDTWEKIQNTLSKEEKDMYTLPWNPGVLELFSKYFKIQILYISGDKNSAYGKGTRKIILADQYILAKMDERKYLQTIF
jgi:hypothetical protein